MTILFTRVLERPPERLFIPGFPVAEDEIFPNQNSCSTSFCTNPSNSRAALPYGYRENASPASDLKQFRTKQNSLCVFQVKLPGNPQKKDPGWPGSFFWIAKRLHGCIEHHRHNQHQYILTVFQRFWDKQRRFVRGRHFKIYKIGGNVVQHFHHQL